MRFDRGTIVEPAFRIPAHIVEAATALADVFPGVLVEDKGEAIAVHWRLRPALADDIRAALVRLLEKAGASDLALMRGHCVFEIKRADVDKGAAVRAFMREPPFLGRMPVFIGDDVTDVDGMAAAKALGGLAFSVSGALPGADGCFEAPAAVRAWLVDFVRSNNS
ncbi:MAG: trehalose-phosphatase [Beijerinckiaceae bacterium]